MSLLVTKAARCALKPHILVSIPGILSSKRDFDFFLSKEDPYPQRKAPSKRIPSFSVRNGSVPYIEADRNRRRRKWQTDSGLKKPPSFPRIDLSAAAVFSCLLLGH
ncbi:hypothetical protein NPIL_142551 [Nephila pilipes]|uniref:Uncharacterized protein n=1 Tax=Nephila pilipes TaxID=299642 RepID=A0A8X6MT72_NEPPI|nr:hypothetical protein NPIL_142551 [Nephila pilipes]